MPALTAPTVFPDPQVPPDRARWWVSVCSSVLFSVNRRLQCTRFVQKTLWVLPHRNQLQWHCVIGLSHSTNYVLSIMAIILFCFFFLAMRAFSDTACESHKTFPSVTIVALQWLRLSWRFTDHNNHGMPLIIKKDHGTLVHVRFGHDFCCREGL